LVYLVNIHKQAGTTYVWTYAPV